MKKISLLTFVLLMAVVNMTAQKIIEDPYFELNNSGIDNISRIELSDEVTKVFIHKKFLPKWWVKFSPQIFIQPEGSETKILTTGIERGEFNKQIFMPESGDSTFILLFPSLDKSVKKINYGSDGKTMIYGVSLETDKAKHAQLKRTKANEKLKAESSNEAWLNGELAKFSVKEPLKDFSADNFFKSDSVRLIGYMKGYDSRLGFSSTVLYFKNDFTGEDRPVVLEIDSTGRFDQKVWIQYPVVNYLNINNVNVCHYYIEPEQSLGIVLDWEEFLVADRRRNISYKPKTEFKGLLKDINKEINELVLKEYEWREYEKDQKSLSPKDFKQKLMQYLSDNESIIDRAVKDGKLSMKSSKILNAYNFLNTAERLLDYTSSRAYYAQQEKDNEILKIPVENDYYDFLQKLPLNETYLLTCSKFGVFINRFEYCKPFQNAMKIINEENKPKKNFYEYLKDESNLKFTAKEKEIVDILSDGAEDKYEFYSQNKNAIDSMFVKYENQFVEYEEKYGVKNLNADEYEKRAWEIKDSIYQYVFQLQPSLVYDIVKSRYVCGKMNYITDRSIAEKLVNEYNSSTTNVYLKQEVNNFFQRSFPEDGSISYELPDVAAATLFKKLVEPFKGKYVLVDFWETWCGPCVSGIKYSKEVRERLKDSNDIAFVYICSTESPLSRYNDFIKEQGMENSYRLSEKEYEYMRELFKFNGIPHYETVDRDGKIMRKGISPYDIENFLKKLLEKENNHK